MLITEREVKRIVSNYCREKYEMHVQPQDMEWEYYGDDMEERGNVFGLEIGGDIVGEDDSDSH